jgi:hypothetical protein
MTIQDVQKGQVISPAQPQARQDAPLPERPQRAKGQRVLGAVRGGLERSENDADGIFQHADRPEK